jgi:hypothetical protein
MPDSERDRLDDEPWEEREVQAAAREARMIGGRAGDEDLDPAARPLAEGGEGEAEGFELAEEDLIEAAEHGDSYADPLGDAYPPEEGAEALAEDAEADYEPSAEREDDDR